MRDRLERFARTLLAAMACLTMAALFSSAGTAAAAPTFAVGLTDGANQVQAVSVYATGGQFRLNYGSGGPGVSETPDIAPTATPGQVEAALNSLSNISSGGGSVSVAFENIPGEPAFYVAFAGGPLAHTEAPKMTASAGTVPLSGSGETGVVVWISQHAGVSRSDERIDYTLKVANTAPKNPVVGSLLTCNGVPPAKVWLNATSFAIRWLANGQIIPGATASTYTVQAGDPGQAIQCVVTGSNEAGTGAVSFASQPPVVIEPEPATAPPTPKEPTGGSHRPELTLRKGGTETEVGFVWQAGEELRCAAPTGGWNGSPSWTFKWVRNGVFREGNGSGTIFATANTTSGSNTLSEVAGGAQPFAVGQIVSGAGIPTANGTGTLTSGSATVTATPTVAGGFLAGQTITGAGIPAGTTIIAASGTTTQTLTLSSNATASGTGVEIAGSTTVTAVSGQTLTLSNNATATATGAAISGAATGIANTTSGSNTLTEVITAKGSGTLTAASKNVTGVTTTTGAFAVGQRITGTGVQPGTTIAAIGAGTLELSLAAEISGTPALAAGAEPFAVGQLISGAGIPPNTTVTAVSGQTVTLSKNATATASGISVAGGEARVTSTTATTSRLQLPAGSELTSPGAYQCQAIATNPGGTAVAFSGPRNPAAPAVPFSATENAKKGPNQAVANTPAVESTVATENKTSGTVRAELELPGGLDTSALKTSGSGWSCEGIPAFGGQHAKAVCTRSDALNPHNSYPEITVRAGLGAGAPALAVAKATISGGGAAAATAEDPFVFQPLREFGLSGFEATINGAGAVPFTQAGGHPLQGIAIFPFTQKKVRFVPAVTAISSNYAPIEEVKQVFTDLPRGQVANPLAVPELCPSFELECEANYPGSRVGIVRLLLPSFGVEGAAFPIFAMKPEFGTPAQFAFRDPTGAVYTITGRLRADDGYGITLEVAPAPEVGLLRARAQICNFGIKGSQEGGSLACKIAGEADPDGAGPLSGANPKPLFTNPTRCGEPAPVVGARLNSWEHPSVLKHYEFTTPQITGCNQVHFEPKVELEPTNHQADSPTGLNVAITMPTDGLESQTGISQANLDTAEVTFPKGMSINPASADGLGACSPAQVKLGSNEDDECPASSKVGTVEIKTPLIQELLTGNVYVAKQNDNPFETTLGLYMVFSSKKDGITIKVAGKLVADPVTGQIKSVFTENPEDPFSKLTLKFNSGPRAPLINPPACGEYAINSQLSPWSAASPANPTPEEIVSADSSFEVTEGPGGGPCPTGNLEPKLKASLQNPQAGSKSTFNLTLSREDGSMRFTGLDVAAPKGLTAYLKGIPYCPDAVLAGISGNEEAGRPELEHPACPAASQVGTVVSGAGAGAFPFQAPGRVYLAGPYKGAPISLAVVAPAVAGPFDLGNVVIRNGLYIDPQTAQVTAKSDPIPTILHGILLDIRQIRLALDRPNFTAAPTSCAAQQVVAQVKGESGGSATAAVPFGVNGCDALGFHPKLGLRLFGGTKRGSHPRLVAKLTYPPGPGYANIASASVALPHSEFLDQAHIRTVCTRVQFAARQCPAGAIYGEAEASTPLLDQPLRGPVYLRSSDNPLPDLVAALRGPDSQPIEVVLDGRIDSVHGGIRTTFDSVPDQPVSSFTLRMQGGKKGLLVNSRDTCKTVNKATANFAAQNGRSASLRPVLANACKQAAKKHGRHKPKH